MRAPKRVVHDKRPRAAEPMPHHIGRADRAAGISGGGLHVDAAKRRHAPYLAVGDGIHRAAAGECDVGQAKALLQRADQMKERLFIHRLHRAGDIAVPILERIFGPAPRAQQLLERRRKQIAGLRRRVFPLVGHLLGWCRK